MEVRRDRAAWSSAKEACGERCRRSLWKPSSAIRPRGIPFHNEAELQHELGYWLRRNLPLGMFTYFERPASSFFPSARGLVKKEIDLVVAPEDRSWHLAIELKCPRSGRVPETMFDACRDLQFLEQLITAGFRGGLFVMHAEDPAFYQSGMQTGIYSYFRGRMPLTGAITKPTGSKDQVVSLGNSYLVHWQHYGTRGRYWLQVITDTANQLRLQTGHANGDKTVFPV